MTSSTPRGITETDVWQAADALLLEGARPTIERVRQKIGRGSPNTVSPYLETWFKTLGARIADPKAFSAPPALPDPIAQAAKHFWETALTAARAEGAALVEVERAELATARRALEAERVAVRAEATQSLVQAQAKEEALQVMRTRAAESQARQNTLAVEIEERNRILLEVRAEITRVQADREALRRQLDSERATFEADRKALEAREAAQAAHWAAEVDRAREATKGALARASHLEREGATRADQLRLALETAERERREVTDHNTQMALDVDRLRTEHDAGSKAFEASQQRSRERETQLLTQCERVQTQLTEALAQLAAKDREHGALLRSLLSESKENTRTPRRPRDPPVPRERP